MQDWTPLGHALIALGVQAAACGVCVFSGLSLSAGAGAGAAVASALYYGREHAQEERRQGRAWYKVLIPDRTGLIWWLRRLRPEQSGCCAAEFSAEAGELKPPPPARRGHAGPRPHMIQTYHAECPPVFMAHSQTASM